MTRTVRAGWKVLAVAVIVAFGVVTYRAATATSAGQLAAAVERAAFAQCVRGNAMRAYLRLDASRNARDPEGRRVRADRLFPLLDCRATVEQAASVPASPGEQARMIREFDRMADGR